jgi:hypothetical protein
MSEYLRNALKKPAPALKAAVKVVLDGVGEGSALPGADAYTQNDISLKAVAAVQQWVETDDLDSDEDMAGRLMSMIVGIADANKDGEISDDEQAVVDVALNAIWDYLLKYEVDEDDISALLSDWDSDAADRIRDLLAASLPEGEAADADLDNFVFGDDQEPALDAVYKKTLAIRGGKKVRINKRISGHVKLSAKQKVAIKKVGLKSHSAAAMMRRAKSMRMRVKSGL